MAYRVDLNEFLERCKIAHGCKYDYSLVEYKNTEIKVSIICKIHGEFQQAPRHHFAGKGCSKCAKEILKNSRRHSINYFVSKSNNVHNFRYKYDQVKYVNNYTKVTIYCPLHKSFDQTPAVHLRGGGCYKCARIEIAKQKAKTKEQFIEEANLIHCQKYDYSLLEYKNNAENIKIICPTHGEFYQCPFIHLNGSGCKECSYDSKRYSTEEFICLCNGIHLNKYNYNKTVYKNSGEKVTVNCPKHGYFEIATSNHIKGQGCPMCRESNGERMIRQHLESLNVPYERQKKFKTCKRIRSLPFDFCIKFKLPILIEYQGNQHYNKNCRWFKQNDGWEKIQESDKIKYDWALANNTPLLIIPHWNKEHIPQLVDEFLEQNHD